MSAFYRTNVGEFLNREASDILGQLNLQSRTAVSSLRVSTAVSWERTVSVLKAALAQVISTLPSAADWGLLLEYEIPRRDRRIDAVLLVGGLVLVFEFKTGESETGASAQRQAEHYAMELRDFHRESRGRRIVPIVVSHPLADMRPPIASDMSDPVLSPLVAGDPTLAAAILYAVRSSAAEASAPQIDLRSWDESAYEPVPNIVEAAQMLYAHQSVRELSHAHAEAWNLTKTADVVVSTVARARREKLKVVCFVTGVPGAGKTLAGLNAVHSPELTQAGQPAGSFLSGNGPLVKIITEALARHHHRRTGETLDESRRKIRTFIQSVHSFLKEYRVPSKLPPEHVVVFDEAQRAWDADKVKKEFLRRATADERDALREVNSEPAMMVSIMNRLPDWAVIVALVGGGQEIHDGEAGLAEWGRAIREQFPHWRVVASPEALHGGPSVPGSRLFTEGDTGRVAVTIEPHLHLPVSVRPFRAEAVAKWVNAVVNGSADEAAAVAAQVTAFPIVFTRSLGAARDWLHRQTRGFRRSGLLASSGALRLRAHGLEVSSAFRGGFPFDEWFLSLPPDIRSSNMLEVALTEFECQGLELDWTGVCWGGDFIWSDNAWRFRHFKGTAWQFLQKAETQEFIRNKYRVLLTRAREGTVIWVPGGDADDPTREPVLLDATAEFLLRCGARPLV
jgi:hypothetical protein